MSKTIGDALRTLIRLQTEIVRPSPAGVGEYEALSEERDALIKSTRDAWNAAYYAMKETSDGLVLVREFWTTCTYCGVDGPFGTPLAHAPECAVFKLLAAIAKMDRATAGADVVE